MGAGPAHDYQVKFAGPEEIQIPTGDMKTDKRGRTSPETVWADGFRILDGTIIDTKYVSGDRTPFRPAADTGIPDAIHAVIRDKQRREFERYAKALKLPENHGKRLEIITNDPAAVEYFDSLIKQVGLIGRVVIRKTDEGTNS